MTIANVSSLVTQVVLQESGTSGGLNLTALFSQVVQQNEPGRVFVSALQTQVVERNDPRRFLVPSLKTQVVIQNLSSTGGKFNVAAQYPQVVYSTGTDDQPRQRAWTFDFDGHTFYVLDLGETGALAYNLTTQSWQRFNTTGYDGHFNFKNGFHWRGGKQIVGGGLLDGLLLKLDPDKALDEGFKPIEYEIQGVLFATTEDIMRQYNLRMVGSPGRTFLDDDTDLPILRMVFSDDNGATWSTERTVTLSNTDKDQRIEFRSLGGFRQPGRIFRLYDDGGIKFIAYVMADLEGE